jgi:hypothetical protein
MEVFGVLVDAGHLDRRHQLDTEPLRCLVRLGYTRNRIVIRKRQRRNSGFPSLRDDFAGRKLPVGDRRMRLKLDQHGSGEAIAPTRAPQPSSQVAMAAAQFNSFYAGLAMTAVQSTSATGGGTGSHVLPSSCLWTPLGWRILKIAR